MNMKRIILAILLISLLLSGCTAPKDYKEDKLVVYTSFYPLYFLSNEIGKDNIELEIIVPTGVEAHDYEPTIKQLKNMENTDIFIYNGAGLESWSEKLLDTIVNEEKAINASDIVDLINVDGGVDPHIWLSPKNMILISEKIKDRFISSDSTNKEEYEKNYNELINRLEDLDNTYSEVLKQKKRDTILVSHKAFGYMVESYDLNQVSVTGINPEQEPSPKTIANVIDLANEENFEYIFLETLTSSKTVDVIAKEANLKTLVLNPIEGLTEDEEKNGEDYISIMEKNLQNLKKALVD